jgi:hypothetical protein
MMTVEDEIWMENLPDEIKLRIMRVMLWMLDDFHIEGDKEYSVRTLLKLPTA